MSLLEIKDLNIYFGEKHAPVSVVKNVNLSLEEGEIVGLVGESGSGKTITALSVMRLLPSSAHIEKGEILYQGRDLVGLSNAEMTQIRGSQIAMIFQDPDLNPIMSVKNQLKEIVPDMNKEELVNLLKEVDIPDPEKRLDEYPHVMSGGMKQRIMIAMMLSASPKFLIADEPTTALDVTVQAQILSLLEKKVRERNMGMLLITHNLALVAEYADRVVVMRNGEIVESGSVEKFFKNPTHPYSIALLSAVPRLDEYRVKASPIKDNAPSVLSVHDLSVHFPILRSSGIGKKKIGSVRAVDGVSFSVQESEILGIIGESGCGKTTLARDILRIIPKNDMDHAGSVSISLDGVNKDVHELSRSEINLMRQNIQIVFQESQGALNPRRSVGDSVVEGLLIHKKIDALGCDKKARQLFRLVGIDPDAIDRYPEQFSSGQRQRITIARALALEPRILILDEPVASLDVSIQREVVDLILDLRDRLGLTYIIISHDLALVKDIAHRIAVMYLGKIVEIGSSRDIVENPLHPYTRALISAVPIPDPVIAKNRERIILEGEIPSPSDIPSGCRFRTRCPYVTDLCEREVPELKGRETSHTVACHYTEEIKNGTHKVNASI